MFKSQKQHFMMQAFMMFVLVRVLNFRPAYLVAHYYVGRYTIINVNINVYMYLIFFLPSVNANSSMVQILPGKIYKNLHWLYIYVCIIFLSSVQDNQTSIPPYSVKMKCISKFLKLLFSQFLQNWNQKCSIKGLISHWSFTRFTRDFCLIDDQDYACLPYVKHFLTPLYWSICN